VLDNLALQTIAPPSTFDATDYFEDGTPDALTGPQTGTWAESNGRYAATAAAGVNAVTIAVLPASVRATALVEVEALLRTTGIGGVIFDAYTTNDFKFAALDIAGQRILIGHVDPRRGWVVDATFAKALTANTDYLLDLVMKDTVVTVSLDGNVIGSHAYNAGVADGKVGTLSRSGTTSYDRFRVRTDEQAFIGLPAPPPEVRVGDAVVTEGNSGTAIVNVIVSLNKPATEVTTVTYTTANGSATAGSDYVAVTGSVTFAVGESSKSIAIAITGDTTYEPNETFFVLLTGWGNLNLADSVGLVTIVNDDPVPLTISIGDATVTEGDRNTTTVNVTVTLSRASTSTVTVVVATVAGTAKAGTDFQSKTATLTFNPGVTTLNFQVSIVNDKVKESTETFTVVLSSPGGTESPTIATGTGTVTIIDNDGAMLASEPASGATSVPQPLTEAELAPVLSAAMRQWQAYQPGADFSGLSVTIADLPGLQLGWTEGRSVTIDATAAGWGWSVLSSDDPSAHMDLLTVVLHELGRVLGYTTDDAHRIAVMQPTLAVGEQIRLPDRPRPATSIRAIRQVARPARVAIVSMEMAALRVARPARNHFVVSPQRVGTVFAVRPKPIRGRQW
jgi:hypothetical protein